MLRFLLLHLPSVTAYELGYWVGGAVRVVGLAAAALLILRRASKPTAL